VCCALPIVASARMLGRGDGAPLDECRQVRGFDFAVVPRDMGRWGEGTLCKGRSLAVGLRNAPDSNRERLADMGRIRRVH
jgi:hypothetical protein